MNNNSNGAAAAYQSAARGSKFDQRFADSFDYVIVGAGSAGCVLANRLSADPQVRVLLLEAGGPNKAKEIHIPAAFSKLFNSACDWAYVTAPQPQMEKRELLWPRGKVLGGSSSINAMIYSRANRHDHDRWRATGVTGWDYADILPYYKKGEHNERGADEFHGVGGALNVADLRCVNRLTNCFLDAVERVGIPLNTDINGAQQEGIGCFQVTQKNGQRHSAADAYLKPALARPNLRVVTYAHATQLRFTGTRCTGVRYVVTNGSAPAQTQTAHAEREVILAGGAINSPQLLLLSGIGAAAELQRHDVPVIVDLPGVGANLQDHLLIGIEYECTQPVTLYRADSWRNVARWLCFRQGPLTTNVAEAGGFVHSRTQGDVWGEVPDLELLFAPSFYMNHGLDNPAAHGFAVGVALQKPASRGTVRLRAADPFVAPLIQPNYLSAEADLTAGIAGVKLAREILQSAPFAPYRGKELWPGADARSDEAIATHIRRTADTIYHPVGTCRIGVEGDRAAVVDEQLRVIGTSGLRVVDASVIPFQITGHTHAPTLALAECIAERILRG